MMRAARKPEPLNILVVDDEEEIGKLITKYLSLLGHKARSVTEGRKAINLVKKEYYDVVFSDIVMPGITGIDLLAEIKKISPKTRVIIITGKLVNSRLIDELRPKGVSGFLQKPFKMEDVVNILTELA